MPKRRTPSPALLAVVVAVSLAVAFALQRWGPEWHGGIVITVAVGAAVVATLLGARLTGQAG